MTWSVARREDHLSPACYVKALAVLQVLVYPDGFEALQDLAHLGPLFEHLWRRLEQPKASVYVGSIGGVCQHPCTALAYEGGPRTDVVEVLVGEDYAPQASHSYAGLDQGGADRLALSRPRPPRGRPVGPGLRGTLVLALLPPG